MVMDCISYTVKTKRISKWDLEQIILNMTETLNLIYNSDNQERESHIFTQLSKATAHLST